MIDDVPSGPLAFATLMFEEASRMRRAKIKRWGSNLCHTQENNTTYRETRDYNVA